MIARHTYDGAPKSTKRTIGQVHDLKKALSDVVAEAGHSTRRAHMRETPSRAAALNRIVEGKLLLREDAMRLFPDRKITDPAWEILRLFDPEVRAMPQPPNLSSSPPTKIKSWSLRLITSDETTWMDINPLAFPSRTFPTPAVLAALDDLSADGWKVVHVSEDREVDDAASQSYVIGQRILLARPIGDDPDS